MLCINELPIIITENILNYAVSRYDHSYRRYWTINLPILAVCTTWRTLALPFVYKYAFVEIGNVKDLSNIPTIKANNYTQHVRFLSIEISNSHILPLFLNNFKTIFQFEQYTWINVTMLRFFITNNIRYAQRLILEGYTEKPKFTYNHFVESIIKYTPNLLHLMIDTKKDPDGLFFDNIVLIDAFQSQLVSLLFHSPVIFDTGLHLSNIASLTLKLSRETGDLLPTISPSALKFMQLFNVPSDFSWEYFQNGARLASKIDFISLKSLMIEYSTNVEEEDGNADIQDEDREAVHFSVHFPVLESIHIENGIGLPVTNTTYVFNKRIKQASIASTIDGLQTICNSQIKTIGYLELYLQTIAMSDEMNSNLINPMCNLIDLAKKVSLHIHSSEISLEWNNVRWMQLCKLKLDKCASDFLWKVAVCCPNLENFQSEVIEISDTEYDPSKLGGNTNKSIKRLNIYSIAENESEQKKKAFIEMIVLKFEHFSHIKLTDCRWIKIEKFISRYSQQYPHLKAIQIKHRSICKQECSLHIEIKAHA